MERVTESKRHAEKDACECVRESERDRERETERETDRERRV